MPQYTLIKTARELVTKHNFSGPKLREAIPYINAFSGKRFVLKIGGSVLNDLSLLPYLINDVVFLKKVGIDVILVHGGSRQLNEAMKSKNLPVESKNGLRVTSSDVLELAATVFAAVSCAIENEIEKSGYKCVIFGRESGLIKATQIDPSLGLGLVGVPESVEASLLNSLADNVIPIVSAVTGGTKPTDAGFNVNADDVAGVLASAIKAEKLILMTDVEGVLDASGRLLPSLTVSQAEGLVSNGVIQGGMIPKVKTCLEALRAGTHKCHIIKGSADSFIDEILTDRGVGTEFVNDKCDAERGELTLKMSVMVHEELMSEMEKDIGLFRGRIIDISESSNVFSSHLDIESARRFGVEQRELSVQVVEDRIRRMASKRDIEVFCFVKNQVEREPGFLEQLRLGRIVLLK